MNVRPYTADDVAEVAAIAAADEAALHGRPSRLGPEDVANWLSRVELEPVVFERDLR